VTERIGFIGLGIMGGSMARNLLAAGASLTVYNRTAARTDPLVEAGAGQARTPAELAATSDIVFVCVSDTPDVERVLAGPDGVAATIRPGSLVVDMSTISPEATRRLAAAFAEHGVGYVDAPVSGGSEGAAKGTLSIMAGGSDDDVNRAMPYFEAMGKAITHVGPVGSGQVCKLVNQVLVVVTMLGVSEALLLAQAGGLDPAVALSAVAGGAGGSWMLSNRGPQVIARDWRPGFTIDLQQKDLRLILEEADSLGIPVLATAQVFQLYRTLQREGLGGDGNHALVRALEKLAGVTVGA
jgi:3-hydroxyisobutyrate dehydrogenase-like beta-hydroxyacid dehydrogenase